jgi:hypothetical protein
MTTAATSLATELEEQVQASTDRRVRNLGIEFRGSRVVIRGRTPSYHVKQLALHGLLAVLPAHWQVEIAITVG